ncbi:hypothetical protein BH20ACI4_BH20ACI4_17940 [soil metagenome]
MDKLKYKISLIGLICLFSCFLISSCGNENNVESSDTLFFSDDTTAAAQLITDANEDLNKIKIIYKDNEAKREELKDAMKNNESEKVRKISDDLVYLINDGMRLGKGAIDKISEAREMNINSDFKEYLRLKEESLQKQMDAFENYRQAAIFLRDGYDPKDEKQREAVKSKFKLFEENFHKIMESAQEYSKQANDLAKESAKRGN